MDLPCPPPLPGVLSPGVEFPVDLLEPFPAHVGVNLGRRDVGVAEHDLDGPEVRASLQEVCGERVAERMRRCMFFNSRNAQIAGQDSSNGPGRQSRALEIDEERLAVESFFQARLQVVSNGL